MCFSTWQIFAVCRCFVYALEYSRSFSPGTVQTTQANNFPSAPVFPPTTLIPNPRAAEREETSKEKHTKEMLHRTSLLRLNVFGVLYSLRWPLSFGSRRITILRFVAQSGPESKSWMTIFMASPSSEAWRFGASKSSNAGPICFTRWKESAREKELFFKLSNCCDMWHPPTHPGKDSMKGWHSASLLD